MQHHLSQRHRHDVFAGDSRLRGRPSSAFLALASADLAGNPRHIKYAVTRATASSMYRARSCTPFPMSFLQSNVAKPMPERRSNNCGVVGRPPPVHAPDLLHLTANQSRRGQHVGRRTTHQLHDAVLRFTHPTLNRQTTHLGPFLRLTI